MELNVRISGSFTSGYDAGNHGNVGVRHVRYETTRQRHIVFNWDVTVTTVSVELLLEFHGLCVSILVLM